ncbi:MAG: hypothetical protein RL095_2294 [Verrucomicrobiota bacterium]
MSLPLINDDVRRAYWLIFAALALLTFAWPDVWLLHQPVAALMGPFLLFRLEWQLQGLLWLLLCLALILPLAWRRHLASRLSACLGGLLWLMIGWQAGGWLYA